MITGRNHFVIRFSSRHLCRQQGMSVHAAHEQQLRFQALLLGERHVEVARQQ